MDYKTIKQYYNFKLYDNSILKIFVKATYITAEQYKEITGEVYI